MTKPFQVQDKYFHEAKKLGYRARSAFKLIEIQDKYKLIKSEMRVLDVGAAPGSFLQVIAKIVGQKWLAVGIDIQKIDPNFGFPNVHLLKESIFEYEKILIFLQSIGANNKETNANYEENLKKFLEKSETSKISQKWEKSFQIQEVRGDENFANGVDWIVNDEAKFEGNEEIRRISKDLQFDLITSDIAPATSGMTGVDQYKSIELNLAILEVAKIFLKKDATLILKVFVGEDVNDLIGPIKENFKKLSRMKPKACRDRSFEEYFICQGKKF